jgi:hypothetical protein
MPTALVAAALTWPSPNVLATSGARPSSDADTGSGVIGCEHVKNPMRRGARRVGGGRGSGPVESFATRPRPTRHVVLEDDVECRLLKRPAHAQRPRSQDRHRRRRVDLPIDGTRPGAGQLVPPKEIRELRDLTRLLRTRIEELTREAQRCLDKILQDAVVKLSSVASDVLGRSGRDMLSALVVGSLTGDPGRAGPRQDASQAPRRPGRSH